VRALTALATVVCLASGTARAEYNPRVVLLEPDAPDALSVEVFARLRGELSAAGFEVIVVPVAIDVEPRAALESTGREFGPAAVVLLQRALDATSGEQIAELWISDLLLQRTLIQRTKVNPEKPGRDIARLAVQVAELLKARLAELSVNGERRRAVTERPPEPTPSAPLGDPPRTARLESTWALGVGVLQGFERGVRSWTPLARIGLAFPELLAPALTLELRANAAGLGQINDYSSADGSAEWRQSVLTVELLARFFQRSPVQPLLSLGSGAYVLEVAGQAESPYRARGQTTWSGVSSVGGGVWIGLGSGFAWTADAQVLATWSKTMVRVNEREVWSSGAPIGFASTSLVGAF